VLAPAGALVSVFGLAGAASQRAKDDEKNETQSGHRSEDEHYIQKNQQVTHDLIASLALKLNQCCLRVQ
jgi:hypothetical protein